MISGRLLDLLEINGLLPKEEVITLRRLAFCPVLEVGDERISVHVGKNYWRRAFSR